MIRIMKTRAGIFGVVLAFCMGSAAAVAEDGESAPAVSPGALVEIEEVTEWRNPCFSPGRREEGLAFFAGLGSRDEVDGAFGARFSTSWFRPSGLGMTSALSVGYNDDLMGMAELLGVWRPPMESWRVYPYVQAGAGGVLGRNATFAGVAGGGAEWRVERLNCLGFFAEAGYWLAASGSDAAVVSLGLRYSF